MASEIHSVGPYILGKSLGSGTTGNADDDDTELTLSTEKSTTQYRFPKKSSISTPLFK
jgi:hypothetical protein